MRTAGFLGGVGGVVLLFTLGCVAVQNPRNYEPQDSTAESTYYDCLRQAQQLPLHDILQELQQPLRRLPARPVRVP